MPIIGAVVVLIQFCFAFHVVKTGRPYWWIFVIMAFPVMGCVIYYFVEVFPGSREHRSANRMARNIARSLNPDGELKKRVEELEVCGSVDNKLALAEECMRSAMPEDAMRLYASCLEGAYATDPAILFGYAKAAIEARAWQQAGDALGRLKAQAPKHRPLEVGLLEARLLDGRGETDAALAAYRTLVPSYVGLEAKYRYGELLARLGRHEAALEVFNEVLKQSKRHESSIEDEQRWAEAAREAIRA